MLNDLRYCIPLIEQIDDYLAQGKSWNTLDYSEIEMLAGYALPALGRDADLCLTESYNLDDIIALATKQLRTGRRDIALADAVCNTMVAYLHDHLKELYRTRARDRDHEIKMEAGMQSWINQQTGELEWINPR